MDIPFQGRYDQATVNQAVTLITRPPRWNTRLRWGVLIGYLPIFAYLAAPVLLNPAATSAESARLTRPLLILVLLAAYAVFPYINTFRLARGLWRKPSMQADRSGAITEQGLVYRAQGGDRLLAWPEFTRRRQAPGLVVLLTGPGALTILPRSFFADEAAWRRFQEALDKRLPEGK